MIENPEPSDWRLLQDGVCRIFNEIGLSAKTEVRLTTPRGTVEVDVFAVDEKSVDKIKYVVECKNWGSAIPQTVVHAFTTVMHETGSNIGFIVSRHGLQEGAERYTESTNIIGLTYRELQIRYMKVWWDRYFCIQVAAAADSAFQYVELINSFRERMVSELPEPKKRKFRQLQEKYGAFVMLVQIMDMGRIIPQYLSEYPQSIDIYKEKLSELLGRKDYFKAIYYRDLLDEICLISHSIEEEFNSIFGKNIFLRQT